jgi:hypothetical protein
MSGGHWDYCGSRIRNELERIADDQQVTARWPLISQLFRNLATIVYDAEHEMDWDLSSDSHIADDKVFQRSVVGAVLVSAMKAAPDEWFPRGKWATIQVMQGRITDSE